LSDKIETHTSQLPAEIHRNLDMIHSFVSYSWHDKNNIGLQREFGAQKQQRTMSLSL